MRAIEMAADCEAPLVEQDARALAIASEVSEVSQDPERGAGGSRFRVKLAALALVAAGACVLVARTATAPPLSATVEPDAVQNKEGCDKMFGGCYMGPKDKQGRPDGAGRIVFDCDEGAEKVMHDDFDHGEARGDSHFTQKGHKIRDVGQLPRCLTHLRTRDPQLGGELKRLPGGLNHLAMLAIMAEVSGSLADLAETCPDLEHLHLNSRSITGDLYDLKSLQSLKHLSLPNAAQVEGDIMSLGFLPSLEWVDFQNNNKIEGHLSGLTTFQPLTKLKHLDFWQNEKITGDLSDLSGLPLLKWVCFHDNPKLTGDLGSLKGLMSLQNAIFQENYQIKGNCPAHVTCQVHGELVPHH